MELRAYLEIIYKNIQLIIVFTLISLTLTLLFTTQQTPIYEATSTYVTGLRPGLGFDNTIYALDTLSGRQSILVTYCELMKSGAVRQEAIRMIGYEPTDPQFEKYEVLCTLLPESSIMNLAVNGPDQEIVRQLNNAVGIVGSERANSTVQYFKVDLLDEVFLAEDPISPNYLFNTILGLALGVAVSITIVFLLDYLRTPAEKMAESSIYEVRLNVYNNRYAQRRLTEEIERAKMQNRLLAVALIDLEIAEESAIENSQVNDLLLRQAAARIRSKLRATDILAHRQGSTFTLIMPETQERTALRLIRSIHEALNEKPVEAQGAIANFSATTGMIENNGGMHEMQTLFSMVQQALDTARANGSNTIEFIRTKPSPFALDNGNGEVESMRFEVDDPIPTPTPRPNATTQPRPTSGTPAHNKPASPFATGNRSSGQSALDRVVGTTDPDA